MIIKLLPKVVVMSDIFLLATPPSLSFKTRPFKLSNIGMEQVDAVWCLSGVTDARLG